MPPESMYDHKKAFQSYLAKTTEKDIFVQKFAEKFRVNNEASVQLLDLGCHDGTLTLRLLNSVADRLRDQSVITCVDPSHEAIQTFKQRTLPENIRFLFVEATAETFFAQSSNTFDWIIASHCLYWSPQLEEVLAQICGKGERSVIVLRGNRGIYQVQSKFKDWLGNPNEQLYTADDIESALSKLKISFTRENMVSTISIPEPDDPILPYIFAFFLQTQPERINSDMIAEIYSFVKGLGTDLTHDVSFFWTSDD